MDHADMRQELLLRSFDPAAVDALAALLQGVGRHGRGLPQMLEASDRLADAYLDIIDRRLLRSGYELHRYADDVRVLADGWDQANEIIETAAGHARSLGLILSSAKTGVRRKDALKATEDEALNLINQYMDEARSKLSEVVLIADSPYETEFEVLDPDDAEALIAAYRGILQNWHLAFRKSQDERLPLTLPLGMVNHINTALAAVANDSPPLGVDLLTDLVFHEPTRLENVCRYLLEREKTIQETEALSAPLLTRLTSMGRQGPWAKLWLLHVTNEVASIPLDVEAWVQNQLTDPHETVRAEAAWSCASRGKLGTKELERCYAAATEITAPALAAAAAKQNHVAADAGTVELKAPVVQAIRLDGPLNKEAYKWATQ